MPTAQKMSPAQSQAAMAAIESAIDHPNNKMSPCYLRRAVAEGVSEEWLKAEVARRAEKRAIRAAIAYAVSTQAQSEAAVAAIESAINRPDNKISPDCLRRAVAEGVSEEWLKAELERAKKRAISAAIASAVRSWRNEIDPILMRRAVALGVSETRLKEAARREVQKRKDEIRRENEAYEERKRRALVKIKEVSALVENSSKVEADIALETLDLVRKYYFDGCGIPDPKKHLPLLIKVVLNAQPSQVNQMIRESSIYIHISAFMDIAIEKFKDTPELETSEYLSNLAHMLRKENPLFQTYTGQTVRERLIVNFVIDKEGFRHFCGYVAARPMTQQFPSLEVVLSILNAVNDVLGHKRASKRRTQDYQCYATTVWAVAQLHINSSSFDHQDSEYVTKVCEALVAIKPGLKDFSRCASDHAATARVSPSNHPPDAADTFSAIESAKCRLESFGRMKAKTANIVGCLNEHNDESRRKLQAARTNLEKSKTAHDFAAKEINHAESSLASAKLTGVAAVVDYAERKALSAKQLESSTRTALRDATAAHRDASETERRARKALEEAESEHGFAAREIEEAKSYMEKLYEEREVIDVDATVPDSPARKKLRRSKRISMD